MRQYETEPDEDSPASDAESEGPTPRATDGTRRPGSNIVGESTGPARPGTWKPLFTRASLSRDRADPSHRAGRTALAYVGVVIGVIAIAVAFLLLVASF